MKILVLTSRFPFPLEKGDKLRIYNQMRELARAGHDIVLIALAETAVLDAYLSEIKQFCSRVYVFPLTKKNIFGNILRNILRGPRLPFQVAYFFNSTIKSQIERVIAVEKPDHIYCHLVRMSEYVSTVDLPKTLDFMDAFGAGTARRSDISNFFLRPLWRFEAVLMLNYEKRIAAHFNNLTIISEQDRVRLPISAKVVSVVGNGVDINFFSLMSFEKKNVETTQSNPKYDVCFVGNLGYYSNVEAVRYLIKKIFPLLKAAKPDIRILLAGARPTDEIQSFANENITVLGWLDDIREAYAASRILVAPLMHGIGQQNKILEAMAMHVPVVSTSRVNNAIGATPETEILVADTEGSFAEQILRLLQDIDLQQLIADNGRAFVEKKYSWQGATKGLERLMSSLE